MDVQAELANAIKQRYTKNHGVPRTSRKMAKGNGKINRRQEPAMSDAEQASRREAKKAAAAALVAKMGGRQPTSSSLTATDKKKKGWKIPFSSSKASSMADDTVTGGGPLCNAEEETAERYGKMMKMGLPKGAVRHKMISDGVSERIIEVVMSGEDSSRSRAPVLQKPSMDTSGQRSSTRPSLSLKEENIAEKYRKMMKIGMPEGAVLHKMIADGVSGNIQDAVMAGDSSSAVHARKVAASSTARKNLGNASRSSRSSLLPKEEKIAAQYRTMIKIKMPEGAVRHKMIADGVSAKIQDSVLDNDVPGMPPSSSPPSSATRGGKTRGNISSLSREDEMTATPYRKMMKMGMPEGAVNHKMTRDGISAPIKNSILRQEIPNEHSEGGVDVGLVSPMRPPGNPMSAVIASSGGIGSLKKTSVNKKKTAAATAISNPLAAAIASSGGIGSLKKTSVNKKKTAAAAVPSNPLVAAIASSGGIGSLKKTSVNKKKTAAATAISNPLAAAIASSGGIRSLKKTSVNKKKTASAAVPSNPLVAAITSSGGIRSLKKTSMNKKKTALVAVPSHSLATTIAASGGRNGLKKTRTSSNDNNLQLPKPGSSNSLVEEISSRGLRSRLKTTPQKSPDVSTSDSLMDVLPSSGSKLQEESTEMRHLSGIKIKSVRMLEEPPERSTNVANENDSPRRFQSDIKIKSIRSPEDSPERSTEFTNEHKTRRFQRSPEVSTERSTEFTNKHNTRGFQSGIKIKSVRSPEESPERSTEFTNEHKTRRFQSGIRIKSVRLLEDQLKSSTIIDSVSKNPSRNVQEEQPRSTTNIQFRDAAALEMNFRNQVNQNIKNQSLETGDDSQRSRSRTPNSKAKKRRSYTVTTDDGVDHHCQCIVM